VSLAEVRLKTAVMADIIFSYSSARAGNGIVMSLPGQSFAALKKRVSSIFVFSDGPRVSV
jgi:hypothetical protein